MRKNMPSEELVFGVPREVENGMTEILLPYNTTFKAKCRYPQQVQAYPVEDNEFGCNCYVFEMDDLNSGKRYKKLYINVPEELLMELTEFSRGTCSTMRKDEEHTDKRPVADFDDENGDWHSGTLDQVAYAQYKRECEENEADAPETYDEATLRGALSDNPKIRNAQIRDMCKIIDKAIGHFPLLLQKTFEELFCLNRRAVDIAEEDGVGKSAITNRKNRLIDGMRSILMNIGYIVPSKAELRVEKKAIEQRKQQIKDDLKKQREEELEVELVRELTALFYGEGLLDQTEMERIEKQLDEAA